ncbi:proline iminopeptidase-family hydrolase [Alicyclobacillus acidocaldarius]|uniref:Proline iminopeptidase n=1 Tax=Alicyclobacillus acidocaldarius subsp. acidocaldarius (strain ATCC 27009 / DSM 446 / BCRC 14685 / JCM 5260 / KCTC 1825 / NBRC 15652 / NCIMB 11725 / NRRL B-14509 / 104-IA) TaxID=521098 RepID=C8WR03_ALIAD|nr:proline iminopeptidase-family hydrolase [Alicyclobacillus acidocaldarius]ACV59172.1 proline-specific peptidase [Alicyclobacillus acidocaldarius subsp. acidocaldarius DSM 446]
MEAQTRIITLSTGHHVWTRRVGTSPIRMLLLHGGPGASHEYFEIFEPYLTKAGIELYFYDQLGSYFSDQPDDPSLWTIDRFRQEVDEVRRAVGLEDFYLLGQSWGGMLALEYALAHPDALKGLVISNMTASIPSYVRYIQWLRQQLPKEIQEQLQSHEERGDYESENYQELLIEHLYKKHLCRLDPWPDAVVRTFAHMNQQVYNTMQGPNEFVVTGNFKDWDRWAHLGQVSVPTLVIGARYDTMDPADIEEMARRIPRARATICPNGSHMSMWDDSDAYFDAIVSFVRDVEAGQF